jgi:hypothetical protein
MALLQRLKGNSLPGLIGWAAAAVDTPDVFEQRIEQVAEQLQPDEIGQLRALFHQSLNKPQEAQGKFDGLGEWMQICQQTIFEIFYRRHEVALPIIRQVAFGEYDWTQIWAIETLCRLATDGIERERIVDEIAEALPSLRYEAFMPAIVGVAYVNQASPKLIAGLETALDDDWDIVDRIQIIEALAIVAPDHARKYRPILEAAMNDKGLENRHPLLDGAVWSSITNEAYWGKSGPPPQYIHQIHAAIVIHRLYPEDTGIQQYLDNWAQNHPDQNVRDELSRYLGR